MKNITIVKVGGAVVEDEARLEALLDDFAALEGPKMLVHGGGRRATKVAEALGVESRMVNGRRVTGKDMLDVVTMVYGGLINKDIVARLQARGVNAAGLSGADMDVIRSVRRPVTDGVDFGFVGDVRHVGAYRLKMLIDAGISGKKIENGLNEFDMTATDMHGILVTHEHIDHIAGLGVMARRYHMPIYATKATIGAIKCTKSVGNIDDELFHPIEAGVDFTIGDIEFEPLHISHDAADPVAYRFKNENHAMAVVTDLGTYDDALVSKLQNLDGLLLEANHDINMLQTGAYPYPLKRRIMGDSGHLSNERSGQLLCELLHDKFGSVILGHLSKENNYEKLAYEAVRLEVTMGDNPYKASDFPMYVAKRDRASDRIAVE